MIDDGRKEFSDRRFCMRTSRIMKEDGTIKWFNIWLECYALGRVYVEDEIVQGDRN